MQETPMNKMTKILLGILGVSLVPLAMLGAMLYFGGTADEPASGTIDLGSATTGYAGTEYAESDYAATTETNENVSDTESDGADSDTGSNAAIIDNVNFYASDIPDKIWKNMQGKSYPKDCTVEKKDLSYVHVLYVDFGGRTCEGELIVNKIISQDIVEIFWELYQAQYPIEKIALIDEYDGDDELSMDDNNTSAFNYRMIEGTDIVSQHGKGLAIDINPFYNPQVKTAEDGVTVMPEDAVAYVDRTQDFQYKIDHDDLCYKLFTEHGFTWGGDWNTTKDYQHFEYDLE